MSINTNNTRYPLTEGDARYYSKLYKKGDTVEKYIDMISKNHSRLYEVQGEGTVIKVDRHGVLVDYLENGSKQVRGVYLVPGKNRFALKDNNNLNSLTTLTKNSN